MNSAAALPDKAPVPAPAPAKVLRALFWKLLFRGRAAQQGGAQQARRQLGLAGTLAIYMLVGILPATMARGQTDSFIFACVLHACTFMFASLTLASNAGTMLFVKEEAEILLHRPVTPQQMLRAKCSVLAGFALLLAVAMNLIGLFVGLSKPGATWRFIPAHLFSTALLMLFSTACIILMYNVCLKWFGRERLDNLLASIQSLLTIAMILGGQVLPRVLTAETMSGLQAAAPDGWVLALPPAWFGALDALIGGTTLNPATLWLPAFLGIAVTAVASWLALEKLGGAYGQGLMNLNESAGAVKVGGRPRGRWLRALVSTPPLRWWLRDPVERQAFLLTAAYLVRDREVKLRLYPGIAPMLIMPLFMLFTTTSSRGGNDMGVMVQGFAACFLGMVPLQAMLFLGCSEHWRASAFFHSAPLPHWAPLFHGARKAVLACLTFPALLLQVVLVCSLQRSLVPVLLTLPAVVFLPAFSLITGVVNAWLPLSKPSEEVKNNFNGCLVMAVTMAAAGLVGGLASWTWAMGWFWPCLAALSVVMLGAGWMMKKIIRRKPWPALGE